MKKIHFLAALGILTYPGIGNGQSYKNDLSEDRIWGLIDVLRNKPEELAGLQCAETLVRMEGNPVKVSCAGRTLLTAADFPNGGYEIVQVEPSTTKPSLAGFGRFLGLNVTRSELIYARAIERMDLRQQMFIMTSGAQTAEEMRQNLRPTAWDIDEAIQRTQTLLAAPDWDKAVGEMHERVFKQTTAYQLLDLRSRLNELERRGPGF